MKKLTGLSFRALAPAGQPWQAGGARNLLFWTSPE